MRSPIFSVIVPIYKVENYLDKCVQSIINQTYSDIEIILVDDGSPDSCPRMCDKYKKEDTRVKVIHKKNGGLSDARNAGISLAKGKYIVFVDGDDYISADTCEMLLPFTEKGYDIIAGNAVRVGGREKKLSQKPNANVCYTGEEYLKTSLKRGSLPVPVWHYIFNTRFLKENNLVFKYGILHEDEQFTPRAFLKAKTAVNSGICFYNYVKREGSIMTQKNMDKNLGDLYGTCIELTDIYSAVNDKKLKKLLYDSLVMKYLSLYQDSQAYRYGKEYIHKDFVIKNAYCMKTKCKAVLFNISPRLYWKINNLRRLLKKH